MPRALRQRRSLRMRRRARRSRSGSLEELTSPYASALRHVSPSRRDPRIYAPEHLRLLVMHVLIAGVSTRAFAESAARAGFEVTTIDAFADVDYPAGVRRV